jgi:hypothetical protein
MLWYEIHKLEADWKRYTRNTTGSNRKAANEDDDIFETLSIEDTVGYR